MHIYSNKVIGLPVVTLNEGKKMDTIKDVVFDRGSNLVTALVLHEKGWFNNAEVIFLKEIESIGEDAVIVKHELKIVDPESFDSQPLASKNSDNFVTRIKIPVLTDKGEQIGYFSDVKFDFPTGKVSEYIINKNNDGEFIIDASKVVNVGEDVMIVSL
jgi:uncharacterized protein YrrD